MQFHDAPLARPTADWISHYAAGLLDSTPSMHPLDAVRQAMEVSAEAEDAEHARLVGLGVLPPGSDQRG